MSVEYIVKCKIGNLVQENDTDFIVNASNTVLMLGSGVSMAFSKHCGNKLQLEMNQLLSEIHETGYKLKKGDVVPSSSVGASNFKHALHVAVLDYNSGVNYKDKKPMLCDIDSALHNIEKIIVEYAKLHHRANVSLVMPLIGCGFGGLDKKEVIKLYKDFFSNENQYTKIICQVTICCTNDNDLKLIIDVMS